jgi:hemerythrin
MPFLEWKDAYDIGVKEIDNQHRGLFDIIDKLFGSRKYDSEGKYFSLTLIKFYEYAQIHFSTEERYMRETQYPRYTEHQHEHEQFITQVSKLILDVENKEPEIENKVLTFLKEWYLAHILGTDRNLEKWFQEKGIS